MLNITTLGRGSGPTVAALGYFDGVHRGHGAVIAKAVALADELNSKSAVFRLDMSTRRAAGKGQLDLLPETDCRAAIEALGVDIDLRVDFDLVADMTGAQFADAVLADTLRAKAVVCGPDFRFGKGRAWDVNDLAALCEARGIGVHIVPAVEDEGVISTTRVKEAVLAGDMQTAARLLGRPYAVTLRALRDKGLARKLGFPTLNQRLEGVLCPRKGVYLSAVRQGSEWLPAITNAGVRPTVKAGDAPCLETHILDFDGDLYGADVTVRLLAFLRAEQRFADVETLRDAVAADVQRARALLDARKAEKTAT